MGPLREHLLLKLVIPSFCDVISTVISYEVQATGMQEQGESLNILAEDSEEHG
jgi:hypothetical protein